MDAEDVKRFEATWYEPKDDGKGGSRLVGDDVVLASDFDAYVKQAEQDLALNASMLARQTDLARQAEAELSRVREALVEYGTHLPGCPAQPGWSRPAPCTCGLSELLAEKDTI